MTASAECAIRQSAFPTEEASARNAIARLGLPRMRNVPDEALLRQIVARDGLAIRVLFERHQVRIYRFVLRLVGNAEVAEDVTSGVFLDVWRQAGRFEGRSAVSTWLLAIARFKALTALRRRTECELDDCAAEAIEDPSGNPQFAIEEKDRSAIIRKCLTGLSIQHREIIDLVYYQQKSTEEVAEIVGIPVNTVKTRMFYARKKLSALLQAAGIVGVAS